MTLSILWWSSTHVEICVDLVIAAKRDVTIVYFLLVSSKCSASVGNEVTY